MRCDRCGGDQVTKAVRDRTGRTRVVASICCNIESRWSDSNRRPPIYEGSDRPQKQCRRLPCSTVMWPIHAYLTLVCAVQMPSCTVLFCHMTGRFQRACEPDVSQAISPFARKRDHLAGGWRWRSPFNNTPTASAAERHSSSESGARPSMSNTSAIEMCGTAATSMRRRNSRAATCADAGVPVAVVSTRPCSCQEGPAARRNSRCARLCAWSMGMIDSGTLMLTSRRRSSGIRSGPRHPHPWSIWRDTRTASFPQSTSSQRKASTSAARRPVAARSDQ
jgi:hypothetical protein